MRIPIAFVALLALVLASCATRPRPGEPGYPYNVGGVYDATFVVDGTAYEGSAELETAPGGVVDGDFSVQRPVAIVGEYSGALSADSLAFSGTYTEENGCEGTITATGVVSEGGGRVEGPMRVDDTCGGLLEGSFVFRRPAG